uniref:Uncharacterized protein n=1 Tax=Arundo donax TaxID=35708 RepID=A0A0A9B1M8_ARUDO
MVNIIHRLILFLPSAILRKQIHTGCVCYFSRVVSSYSQAKTFSAKISRSDNASGTLSSSLNLGPS